jgi:hypothetical protein
VCFTNPQTKKSREKSNLENEGAREWIPFFLSNDQETPCLERYKCVGRSEAVHHLTGSLSSPITFMGFWIGSFLIIGYGEEPIPWLLILQIWLLDSFSGGL